jgi:hypothetical protein
VAVATCWGTDAGADSRTVAEHERARMLAAAHTLGVEGAVSVMTASSTTS